MIILTRSSGRILVQAAMLVITVGGYIHVIYSCYLHSMYKSTLFPIYYFEINPWLELNQWWMWVYIEMWRFIPVDSRWYKRNRMHSEFLSNLLQKFPRLKSQKIQKKDRMKRFLRQLMLRMKRLFLSRIYNLMHLSFQKHLNTILCKVGHWTIPK